MKRSKVKCKLILDKKSVEGEAKSGAEGRAYCYLYRIED